MSEPQPIHRVVVLGAGAMGTLHARVLSEHGHRFLLAGVYDPSPAVASDVAGRHRVPVFAREADALRAAELVVVASPIAAHAATVHRALGMGRCALVEKPLCARGAEALALANAPRSSRLFVGHSERFNPVVRALVGRVPRAAITRIELRRLSAPGARTSERSVLLSLGVHDLDLAAYLTGGPLEVREACGEPDAWARLSLVASSRAAVRIYVDRTARARERTIRVDTESALFQGDLLLPRLVRVDRASGEVEEIALCSEEPLAAQALAVADGLEGRV